LIESREVWYLDEYIEQFGDPKKANKSLGHRISRHPVNQRKIVVFPRAKGPMRMDAKFFDTVEKTDVYLDGNSSDEMEGAADAMLEEELHNRQVALNKVSVGATPDEVAKMISQGIVVKPNEEEYDAIIASCCKKKKKRKAKAEVQGNAVLDGLVETDDEMDGAQLGGRGTKRKASPQQIDINTLGSPPVLSIVLLAKHH